MSLLATLALQSAAFAVCFLICQSAAALPLRALAVVTWSACVPDGRSSFHDLFPSGGQRKTVLMRWRAPAVFASNQGITIGWYEQSLCLQSKRAGGGGGEDKIKSSAPRGRLSQNDATKHERRVDGPAAVVKCVHFVVSLRGRQQSSHDPKSACGCLPLRSNLCSSWCALACLTCSHLFFPSFVEKRCEGCMSSLTACSFASCTSSAITLNWLFFLFCFSFNREAQMMLAMSNSIL